MHLTRRILLGSLLTLAALKSMTYLIYVVRFLPFPLETAPLESKMVLLAYRVQQEWSLYPAWWGYPNVSNFYTPIYFLMVGRIGRVVGATIPELFTIGRDISIVSTLLSTVILGLWIARRYGSWAGVAGALVSLGGSPIFNISVTVRPDTMAELLGVSGFFLSVSPNRWKGFGGVILFMAAAMTKQTTLVFLLAACLALAAEGETRRALLIFGGVLGPLIALVAAVTWRAEPYFAWSLVGEGAMPWSISAWLELLSVIVRAAPDLLILPAAGVVLALRQQPRDTAAAALGLVLLVTTLVLSAKVGASQNYYLSLRVAEAVSVGLLWQTTTRNSSPRRSLIPTLLLLATNFILIPSTVLALLQLNYVTRDIRYFQSPVGLSKINKSQRMFQFASIKSLHMLSDWSMVDLYQGDRAVLGDAFLYKELVETGKLSATPVEARVESGSYDAIMTLHDINSPEYVKEQIRLPMSVVDRVKKAYYLADGSLGLYVYLPHVSRTGRENGFRTRVPPHVGSSIPKGR